jgi:hypothetical protein
MQGQWKKDGLMLKSIAEGLKAEGVKTRTARAGRETQMARPGDSARNGPADSITAPLACALGRRSYHRGGAGEGPGAYPNYSSSDLEARGKADVTSGVALVTSRLNATPSSRGLLVFGPTA